MEKLRKIFGDDYNWPLGIHWPWAGVYAVVMLLAGLAQQSI